MSADWRRTNASLRRGFVHYALGKLLSAPLSLLTLVLLARILPPGEYAAWLTCVAVLEISIVLGGLGLEWLMQTTTVAIQAQGNARQLAWGRLLFTGLPLLTQGLTGLAVHLLAHPLSGWLGGVARPEHLAQAGLLIALEGPVRLLRDSFMPILMMQAQAQICTVIRVLGLLLPVLGLLLLGHHADASGILWVETAASAGTLMLVLALLGWRIWRDRPVGLMNGSLRPWLGASSWRFALHAWFSILMMMTLGTDLLIALVARHLGPEATAAFGFAVRWLEVIRRHLPVDLFWGAVRPAVIARHQAAGRNPEVLLHDAWRMVGANLLAVLLALGLSLTVGDAFLGWLSSERVPVMPGLLACLVLLLVGHTLRRVLELMAYLSGASGAFALASVLCLAGPVVVSAALTLWPIPHAAVLAAVTVDLLVVSLAAWLLQRGRLVLLLSGSRAAGPVA